jgi:hypothetical protein
VYQWLFDYKVTARGLEIYLVGFLTVYILRPKNLVSAQVVYGMFGGFDYGSNSFNTIALGNRFRTTWVLVKKRWWPNFLAITPKNPKEFARELTCLLTT